MEQVDEDGPSLELFDGNMGKCREMDIGAGKVADVGEQDGGTAFSDGGFPHELRGFSTFLVAFADDGKGRQPRAERRVVPLGWCWRNTSSMILVVTSGLL